MPDHLPRKVAPAWSYTIWRQLSHVTMLARALTASPRGIASSRLSRLHLRTLRTLRTPRARARAFTRTTEFRHLWRMTHQSNPCGVSFNVARFEAWAPGMSTAGDWHAWACGERTIGSQGEPALQQMPPMLRRHAGRLGRLACEAGYRALGDATGVPVVFCSRYGEVDRSVELLSALAAGASLSPTSFALSVHNAIPGLFAMARRDTGNCVSIAAGDESAAFGVVEACGLLADGADQVLLVFADCPLPSVYEEFADVDPVAFAWAGLLAPAGHAAARLEWRAADSPPAAGRRPPAALTALRFLLGHERELIQISNGREWRWHRDD